MGVKGKQFKIITKNLCQIGIGGSVNLYQCYVPTYSRNFLQIKKQIEPVAVEEQTGKGNEEKSVELEIETLNEEVSKKMDPKIFKSFQHPRFVKVDKIILNSKRKSDNVDNSVIEKKPKLLTGGASQPKHKFQFY